MNEKEQNKIKNWWSCALKEIKQLYSIVGAGLLAALGVVLKPLAIPVVPGLVRISFYFLPTALSAFMFGPIVSGFAAMIIDILGFLIKPEGAFFFGFTLNQFLGGFLYGCWLYRRKPNLWRTFGACATNMVLINFILNPLWLSMLGDKTWLALLIMRVPTNLIMLPINTALLFAMLKIVEKNRLVARRI